MMGTKRVGLVLQDLLCGAGGALPSDAKAAALDGILMDGEMQRLRSKPWILALVDLIHCLHISGKCILDRHLLR
jgi:hypothetical protein